MLTFTRLVAKKRSDYGWHRAKPIKIQIEEKEQLSAMKAALRLGKKDQIATVLTADVV